MEASQEGPEKGVEEQPSSPKIENVKQANAEEPAGAEDISVPQAREQTSEEHSGEERERDRAEAEEEAPPEETHSSKEECQSEETEPHLESGKNGEKESTESADMKESEESRPAKRTRSSLQLDLNEPVAEGEVPRGNSEAPAQVPSEPASNGAQQGADSHKVVDLVPEANRAEAAPKTRTLGLVDLGKSAGSPQEKEEVDRLVLEHVGMGDLGRGIMAHQERLAAILEQARATEVDLLQRLAGSKSMLEQRDELIRQLNVAVRNATQAKEAAQQRERDLEARVAANQRTVATLSSEIAESRETERLVVAALDPDVDPSTRAGHMEALQKRVHSIRHWRRLGPAETARGPPVAVQGPFSADPAPAFPHLPLPSLPNPVQTFDMNGPPPLPPLPNLRAPNLLSAPLYAPASSPPESVARKWLSRALASSQGGLQPEGLRLEAAVREWFGNNEGGDAAILEAAKQSGGLHLADLADWRAPRQQGTLAWPQPGLIPAQEEDYKPLEKRVRELFRPPVAQHPLEGSNTARMRLSPSHNSAFSAPPVRSNVAPLLADILARSSPKQALKKQRGGGRAVKHKERSEGDVLENAETDEGGGKQGTKPRGKRGCPMCGNLLAAAAADCPACGHIFRPSKWNSRPSHGLPSESPHGASLARPSLGSGSLPQLTLGAQQDLVPSMTWHGNEGMLDRSTIGQHEGLDLGGLGERAAALGLGRLDTLAHPAGISTAILQKGDPSLLWSWQRGLTGGESADPESLDERGRKRKALEGEGQETRLFTLEGEGHGREEKQNQSMSLLGVELSIASPRDSQRNDRREEPSQHRNLAAGNMAYDLSL